MSEKSIKESILAPVIGNILNVRSVVLNSPEYITGIIGEDEKASFIKIGKGAENYIYKKLDLKSGTSKEVYKKDEGIWRQLRDVQMKLINSNPDDPNYFDFDKDTVLYIVNERGLLIDLFDFITKDSLLEFKDRLEKFKLILTTDMTRQILKDENDTFKMVVMSNSDTQEDEYIPCVIMETNTVKSDYHIFTGIYLPEKMIVYPSLTEYFSDKSYISLVRNIDLESALENSEEMAPSLYEDYKYMLANDIEISARELISLIKKAGFKLAMKDDADLADFEELREDAESNQKLQDFFNTFKFTTGETAHDILTLSELNKIFKYNKLTVMDVLNIFSKLYLDNNIHCPKINMDLLMGITYNMFYKMGDRIKTNELKSQIK